MLSRRTRASLSISQLAEIKRLLEDTEMSLTEIGMRFDTSGETIRYQGNRMGININERTARLKKPRRKPVESAPWLRSGRSIGSSRSWSCART